MVAIRAITLDLDNTLWDVFPVIERAEQNIYSYLERIFPKIPQRYSVEDIQQMRQELFHSRPEVQHDLTEQRRLLYVQLLEESDYDHSHASSLLQRFLDDRNKVELYPDVLPALERLSSELPIVSLSDGNACLDSIGISKYFAGCVSASQVGVLKPNVRGFQRACALAGCQPAETLHVGDHPLYDMFGARNAGMQTMWMVRENGEQPVWNQDFEPDYRVNSLECLVDLVC